jgi:predicted RNA polymerase sigma factor
VLAALMPDAAAVHGLVALMELQASRVSARIGRDGEPVMLLDQDRRRWDAGHIHLGLAALERARASGAAPGHYTLQAAIAACHARARTGDETDWTRIVTLYDALAAATQSPVVELNRAVAVAMAAGPAAGLELVDALLARRALEGYHLLPAVRADLLWRLGRFSAARPEFERAAAMTRNARERALLERRAKACAAGVPHPALMPAAPAGPAPPGRDHDEEGS